MERLEREMPSQYVNHILAVMRVQMNKIFVYTATKIKQLNSDGEFNLDYFAITLPANKVERVPWSTSNYPYTLFQRQEAF